MKTVLMAKNPRNYEPTDKFEFTGKWRCGKIYNHRDADVEFEVKFTRTFTQRVFRGVPLPVWVEAEEFVEVNVCD